MDGIAITTGESRREGGRHGLTGIRVDQIFITPLLGTAPRHPHAKSARPLPRFFPDEGVPPVALVEGLAPWFGLLGQ